MQTFCSNCGKPNTPEAQFCYFCGTSLPPASAPGQPPGQPQGPSTIPPQPQVTVAPGYIPPAQAPTSSRAIIALVCGIAGLFMCGPLTAIPGVILAKMELNAIRDGLAPPSGKSLAQWAFYVSIAALALFVLGICLFFSGVLSSIGTWR